MKKWRTSYKCRKCGGSAYKVWGGKRRCVVCWAEYYNKYSNENRERFNQKAREKYNSETAQGIRRRAIYVEMFRINDKKHTMKRRKAILEGSVTIEDLQKIVVRDKSECIFCHKKIKTRIRKLDGLRGFDHLIPLLDEEGGHHPWNLAVCCPECNSDKNNTPLMDYIIEKGYDFDDFKQLHPQAFGEILID